MSKQITKLMVNFINRNLLFRKSKLRYLSLYKPVSAVMKDTEDFLSENVGNLKKIVVRDVTFSENLDMEQYPNIESLDYLGGTIQNLQHTSLRKFNMHIFRSLSLPQLPQTLQKMKIFVYCNLDQPFLEIPDNLKKLTLKIDLLSIFDIILNTITHLHIRTIVIENFVNLPPNLTHLYLGGKFDQNVPILPDSITHLSFGNFFNKYINKFPSSIVDLKFGATFNHDIEKLLPQTLKRLELSTMFDHKLNNLPSSLEFLKVGKTGWESHNDIVVNLSNYKSTFKYCSVYSNDITNLPVSLKHAILPQSCVKNLKMSFGSTTLFYLIVVPSTDRVPIIKKYNLDCTPDLHYIGSTKASCIAVRSSFFF
ncbi:hypothetical protein EON71_00515 [bacterium]|nr:MAG: hypothetical protein EON71_00515 [bacterium]